MLNLGMLALPYAASQLGWSALPILLLLGCMFIYSFHLIAQSIETRYKKEYLRGNIDISEYHIDYLYLAKLSLGKYGDKIALFVLNIELFLALVTFLMNIGLNLNTIYHPISTSFGITISSIVAIILALTDLKMAAYVSFLG